jgi:hypothetical protein
MSEVLTISSVERAEPRLRLGAVTLPSSFRYVEGVGDVVGLVGGDDWPARAVAAVSHGARGVLVVDPLLADIDAVRSAVDGTETAVVLDHGWASSPSVARAAEEFARVVDRDALVESRVDVGPGADIGEILSRHLALVRAAVAPVSSLRLLRHGATGYDAVGVLETGARVSLSGVFSSALPEAAMVRTVRQTVTVILELGPVDVAVPGRLRILEDGVERSPLTPFETPHRGAWRRLHDAVVSGRRSDELAAFAADARVVETAIESVGARAGG